MVDSLLISQHLCTQTFIRGGGLTVYTCILHSLYGVDILNLTCVL